MTKTTFEPATHHHSSTASVRNKYQFGFSFDLNRGESHRLPEGQAHVVDFNEMALRSLGEHGPGTHQLCVDVDGDCSPSDSQPVIAPPPSPTDASPSNVDWEQRLESGLTESDKEEAIQKLLGMASRQEAVMAFYYRDADDKV
jgi:hypothetical protein